MTDYTRDFVSAEPEEHDFTVLSKGEYPFTILEINEWQTSKAGNDMLPLKLEFTGPQGTANVFENLVFTEKAIFKINQFLAACAIPTGTRINFRDPDFIKYLRTRKGAGRLDIEEYQNKSGKTVQKNVVAAFVYGGSSKRDEVPAHKFVAPVEDDDGSEIPF